MKWEKINLMKKNPAENFTALQVDPITNEYYVIIPEWIVNEKGWYEDTELNVAIVDDDITIKEKE